MEKSGSLWPWRVVSKTTFSDMKFVRSTPLKIAAALGEVEIAEFLIEHGALVDGIDHRATTPLHVAAENEEEEIAKILIRSDASVNARDEDLVTPYMEAASRGNLTIIQDLVKRGADINLRDAYGYTTLQNAAFQTIHVSDRACSKYLDVIIFLIHKMKDFEIFADTKMGFSIFTASRWRYSPYQTFILNLTPNPSVYESPTSNIISNTVHTNVPINLKRLLRRLPKDLVPKLLAHRDLHLGSPLYAAATIPSERLIDMLLDAGADLDLPGGDHGTPLMGACAAGRLEVVKTLVRKGARTSYVEDGELFSVLTAAKSYPKIIRWLLVGRFAEGPLLIGDCGMVG